MTFAIVMLVALVVTGGIWLLDIIWLKRKRADDAREPMMVEYAKSFFPVILIVFLLRSFLVEPYKIPSGSMMPTLLVGDFILVNKYEYGLRLPVLNDVFIPVAHPERGDVIVFRYPLDTSQDYIKRVVGLPGDTVEYRNKQLYVNGEKIAQKPEGTYSYVRGGLNYVTADLMEETLGMHDHDILLLPPVPPVRLNDVGNFPDRSQCNYNEDGFTCKVPEGHYFMMGDNRDDSNDSRYWGFVPERNLVGKAFLIWWNFDNMGRVGTKVR